MKVSRKVYFWRGGKIASGTVTAISKDSIVVNDKVGLYKRHVAVSVKALKIKSPVSKL